LLIAIHQMRHEQIRRQEIVDTAQHCHQTEAALANQKTNLGYSQLFVILTRLVPFAHDKLA